MTPADGNPGADPAADPAIDAPPLLPRLPKPPPLPPIVPYIPQGPRPAAVTPEILEVLAELRKPPAAGGRWNNFVLLLVTLFLFITAGFVSWTAEQLGLLVLVLLIHEAGHYAAMRGFNYQNVKLFFIPFFGAAVSGRPQNAPGYQRVIVALMGPVPGIAIGVALAIAFRFEPNAFLKAAASMFLFLNAFNLLPLFPFDGGHVLNEVIFSRNRWAEAFFKAVAGLALIGMGFTGGGPMLSVLGFIMLVAAPAAFKISTIVQELRGWDAACLPADAAQLLPEPCEKLVRMVKANFKGNIKPTQVAGIIRTVLERACAQPPTVLACIALLAVYGGAILAAVIGGFVLFAP